LDQASGRFVAFLDSDDLWLPQKLERQLPFMQYNKAALSYTSFRRMSEDGQVVGKVRPIPRSLTYDQLLKNTAIATLTAVVDREISGPIAMTNEGYDDFCLWLSILKRGHVAHGLQEDLARYRVRGGSVSSKPLRSARWVWNIYRNVENLSALRSVWSLAHFGARAWLKRREF
jgi:teichuronic acid biosynthesis glycosyltransferase TuaG